MRHVLVALSVLILGLCYAVAQDAAANAGQMSQTSAAGETTVQGCLSGANGSYTLTDKNGMSYSLTGDTAKLSEHVGHEVKITGTASSGAAAPSSSQTGSSGTQQTLQVSSVKHISKTCQSNNGMSH
jgi:Protein of unknown function (DUF5818)